MAAVIVLRVCSAAPGSAQLFLRPPPPQKKTPHPTLSELSLDPVNTAAKSQSVEQCYKFSMKFFNFCLWKKICYVGLLQMPSIEVYFLFQSTKNKVWTEMIQSFVLNFFHNAFINSVS